MLLIVPSREIVLAEVAQVKRDPHSDWRGALDEPIALWGGDELAEALDLIEQLPESELMRCFTPAFGLRLRDEKTARAEVLFCFKCDMALTLDLQNPEQRNVGATFDSDSDPARELLSRFQRCATDRIKAIGS